MEKTISVKYPESLANSLKLAGKDFENEIKRTSLIKLFEKGKISSGVAAKILGLQRIDFLDLLAAYKVSTFGVNDMDDLGEDISNA